MDIGHTYATPSGQRVMLYADPLFEPPEVIVLGHEGRATQFARLAPDSIYCDDVPGVKGHCENRDCHRSPLGVCACGRHQGRQKFVRAVR